VCDCVYLCEYGVAVDVDHDYIYMCQPTHMWVSVRVCVRARTCVSIHIHMHHILTYCTLIYYYVYIYTVVYICIYAQPHKHTSKQGVAAGEDDATLAALTSQALLTLHIVHLLTQYRTESRSPHF